MLSTEPPAERVTQSPASRSVESAEHAQPSAADPERAATRVLVVDDEEAMRHFVRRGLRRLGFAAEACEDGESALAAWSRACFDVAIVDLKMPGLDGLAVLARIRAAAPDAAVILMTAHGTIATAVEAMKLGAFDFVTKPFEIDELRLRIERAVEHGRMRAENRNLRVLLDRDGAGHGGLIGRSDAMLGVYRTLDLVAKSSATVLISGEPGTGKGLVARALHAASERAGEPFVTLHCSAPPDTLFESELFGHEAGAFTGAKTARRGLIVRAHRGTLLLDEIADLSASAQAKLERFLQDRQVTPLGGTVPVPVDVRVVATTNRDPHAAVRDQVLRPELVWQLDVVRIHVPPLRERRDDIPLLVEHVLSRLTEAAGRARPDVTAEAMAALCAYAWPGNVRELENVVERMVVLAGQRDTLGIGDLPKEIGGSAPAPQHDASYTDAIGRFEREYFTKLLARVAGNVSQAAREAGLSRGHLHRRVRELGIDASGYRA